MYMDVYTRSAYWDDPINTVLLLDSGRCFVDFDIEAMRSCTMAPGSYRVWGPRIWASDIYLIYTTYIPSIYIYTCVCIYM